MLVKIMEPGNYLHDMKLEWQGELQCETCAAKQKITSDKNIPQTFCTYIYLLPFEPSTSIQQLFDTQICEQQKPTEKPYFKCNCEVRLGSLQTELFQNPKQQKKKTFTSAPLVTVLHVMRYYWNKISSKVCLVHIDFQ